MFAPTDQAVIRLERRPAGRLARARHQRLRPFAMRPPVPADSLGHHGLVAGDPARLFPSGNEDFAFDVRLLGWRDGDALYVTQPTWAGHPLVMGPGEPCRIRLFRGRRAISFRTTVLGMEAEPAPRLALAYPAEIMDCKVRTESRTEIDMPARAGAEASARYRPCRLRDLSLRGLRLNARAPIAPPGSRIVVRFAINIDGTSHDVALAGEIRNLGAGTGGDPSGWDHGVEFDPIAPEVERPLAGFLLAKAYPEG